ncbi:MAG: diguanylate cyclase [Clostridia bacterium]|nr:diguanylate cyclase [Clostridia bacterium]
MILPTSINLITTLAFIKLSESESVSLDAKKYFAVINAFVLCEVVTIYHTYYVTTVISLAIPLVVSTLFDDKAIINRSFIASELGAIPYVVIQANNYISAAIDYHIVDYFVIFVFLVCEWRLCLTLNEYFKDKTGNMENDLRLTKTEDFAMMHDEITGLYNYGFFKAEITKRVEECNSDFSKRVFLTILEIDDIKQIIESPGMEVAQNLQRAFAKTLKEEIQIEKGDVFIAKISQYQFGMIFNVVTPDFDVLEAIKQFKLKVLEKENEAPGESMLTFTAGIVEYKLPWTDDEFYKKAEYAIGEAKKKGNNQLIIIR